MKQSPVRLRRSRCLATLQVFTFWFVLIIGFFWARPCSAQEYHWSRAYFPQNNTDPWSSVAFNPLSHGRVLFAGPHFVGGVFRSDDGGHTWVEHDSLRDTNNFIPISYIHQVFVVPSDTNVVLAVSSDNFFRSTDGGISWNDIYDNGALGGQHGTAFGGMDGESIGYNAEEDAIYYGMPITGVWRSTDHGADWTLIGPTGIDDTIRLGCMDVSQGQPPLLIQGSEDHIGIFARSPDTGLSWFVTFDGTHDVEAPKTVFSWQAVDPATGGHSIAIVQRWPTNDSSLLATTDGGDTWQILNAPVRTWGLDIDQRASMLSKPGDPAFPRPLHFFTGLFDVDLDTIPNGVNGMVQETTDGGISWHSTGFPKGVPGDTSNPAVREIWVLKYDTSSGRIAVATDSGVYVADPTSGVVEEQPDVTPPIQLTQDPDFVSLSSNRPIESIRIFDIAGRQILEAAPMREIFRINTNAYPPGIYALEAFVEGQPPFRKLLQW